MTARASELELPITGPVVFVDLENVQTMDLSRVAADARVLVFFGVLQKKVPTELVVQAQPLGDRLRWIKITGQGPNALDFHIAYYLGRELTERPNSRCVILSRDTGFDPLVRHVVALGATCRRVALLADAFPTAPPKPPPAPQPKPKPKPKPKTQAQTQPKPRAQTQPKPNADGYPRLLSLLAKEKNLPRKRKGLEGKVKNWFPALDDGARRSLLDRLVLNGHLSDADGPLRFTL